MDTVAIPAATIDIGAAAVLHRSGTASHNRSSVIPMLVARSATCRRKVETDSEGEIALGEPSRIGRSAHDAIEPRGAGSVLTGTQVGGDPADDLG